MQEDELGSIPVAVYIGAGEDVVRPIQSFSRVQTFVFVDSLPSTRAPGSELWYTQRDINFISRVINKLRRIGFRVVKEDGFIVSEWCQPHVMRFVHRNGKMVYYYMSYEFPKDVCFDLGTHFHLCDYFIIGGFDSHMCVLDFLPKECSFYSLGEVNKVDDGVFGIVRERVRIIRWWWRFFCC